MVIIVLSNKWYTDAQTLAEQKTEPLRYAGRKYGVNSTQISCIQHHSQTIYTVHLNGSNLMGKHKAHWQK